MEAKFGAVLWGVLAVMWVVVFAPSILLLMEVGGVTLETTARYVVILFPALLLGMISVYQMHKGGLF